MAEALRDTGAQVSILSQGYLVTTNGHEVVVPFLVSKESLNLPIIG